MHGEGTRAAEQFAPAHVLIDVAFLVVEYPPEPILRVVHGIADELVRLVAVPRFRPGQFHNLLIHGNSMLWWR